MPPVLLHRHLMSAEECADAALDLGIALCKRGPDVAALVLPLLESAMVARPDDAVAWEHKG
jgi:hypothetical protein